MEIFGVGDISNKTEDDKNMEPPGDFKMSREKGIIKP
jgi:hypothetical protein